MRLGIQNKKPGGMVPPVSALITQSEQRKTLFLMAAIASAMKLTLAQEPTGVQVSATPAVGSELKLKDATHVVLRTTGEVSCDNAKAGDRVQGR